MAKPDLVTARFETLTFTRDLPVTPPRVFAAFASAAALKQWASPDPRHEMAFEAADFRVGGVDRWSCGPSPDQAVSVEGRYYDIVPDARIVFTEYLSIAGIPASVTLVTNTFASHAGGTRLTVTAQITALTDIDIRKGYSSGYRAALDNLERYLGRRAA